MRSLEGFGFVVAWTSAILLRMIEPRICGGTVTFEVGGNREDDEVRSIIR